VRPEPCLIVLFGAGGDLAGRSLLPALQELLARDLLPERYAVLGSGRTPMDDTSFRELARRALDSHDEFTEDRWGRLAPRLHYARADAGASLEEGDWNHFADKVDEVRNEHDLPGNTLFHLAVPPSAFGDIAKRLGEIGEAGAPSGWRRLAVEKPFGSDEDSARALDAELKAHFDEDQIFRVDHYLGKETVQNLLVTRFANPGFEPIWNRHYIDHVQITAAESAGVEGRERFYDRTGVVRDMVQNHLLQLLCFVAAEPPVRCFGSSLRAETRRVLDAVRPPDPARDLVLGQYRPGSVDGSDARGYREEESIDADSDTPTFAALRLELDSWRWAGVPFYLRTGKRMAKKATEITVRFRPTPQRMFPGVDTFRSQLTFRLQPAEAVVHTIAAKHPGPQLSIQPVRMSFSYADAFGLESPPSAYAWLIHDALLGDQTLFAHSEWIYRAWSLIDELTERGDEDGRTDLQGYPAGSWGPDEASELLAREGRAWKPA
ncbi:MAG: glucose-6-phosphate dehydrogenase, partial [Gemmatimonadota bacterium]